MAAPYTQAQLDAFWQRYARMKIVDVLSLTNTESVVYEPDFAGMLSYVQQNLLYGFADYTGSCAYPNNGNNKFIGG